MRIALVRVSARPCAKSSCKRTCLSATPCRRPRATDCGDRSARTRWSSSRETTTWCAPTSPLQGRCPHPRSYGAFPRFLGRLRRAYPTVSLEGMVHRMTDRPARRFNLTDRGRIEEGYYARHYDLRCRARDRHFNIRRPGPVPRRHPLRLSQRSGGRGQRAVYRHNGRAGGATGVIPKETLASQ